MFTTLFGDDSFEFKTTFARLFCFGASTCLGDKRTIGDSAMDDGNRLV